MERLKITCWMNWGWIFLDPKTQTPVDQTSLSALITKLSTSTIFQGEPPKKYMMKQLCHKLWRSLWFWDSWKGVHHDAFKESVACVTLSRTGQATDISPTFCSDCRTAMLIYALVTEVYPADLWGRDLQILRHSSCLCEDGLFIYTVCLGSSESWCREFHQALYGTHVWSPPPLLFHPETRPRRSHFHVRQHWCSVCNLQETFLGLLVTLFKFRTAWYTDRCSHLPRQASHVLNYSGTGERQSLDELMKPISLLISIIFTAGSKVRSFQS